MTQQSKYAKRLDKTRPFGTYHPPEGSARYLQDGIDFDHEGYVVEERLTAEQKERLAKKAAPKAPAPQPQKQQQAPDPGAGGGDGGAQGGDDTDLNLELWLKGEVDYPFPDVQKAVKARFNSWITSRRALVLFLVEDQKLATPDELSDELKAAIG